ncbi:MAG: HAD hydrolase-like protein [Lachnospiraceae bacterium]|nr:HAD hydrolase-like protein [Lachnospiraceae bacterium]
MGFSFCFFDLDGTLTQSEFGVGRSIRQALAHFGITELSDEELRRYIGPPLGHSLRYYAGLDEAAVEEAIGIYRSYYNTEGYKDAPVYDGVFDALKQLRDAGMRLAVVTSKPEEIAVRVLEHSGLQPYFDDLFGPDMSEADSGKDVLIRRALAAYGVRGAAAEAVMIGDRKYDILGAKAAGTASVGVLYGYGSREELTEAGADLIAETPARIPEVLIS